MDVKEINEHVRRFKTKRKINPLDPTYLVKNKLKYEKIGAIKDNKSRILHKKINKE